MRKITNFIGYWWIEIKFIITLIITLVLAFFAVIYLSGCSPEKRATRKAIKANTISPAKFAELSALWYPVKTFTKDSVIYKQGETTYKLDTINVDCDTVRTNSVQTKIVRVACPPCPVRVDTLYRSREETKESQSALFAAHNETKKAQDANTVLKEKNASQKKALSISMWANAIFLLLIIIWVAKKVFWK